MSSNRKVGEDNCLHGYQNIQQNHVHLCGTLFVYLVSSPASYHLFAHLPVDDISHLPTERLLTGSQLQYLQCSGSRYNEGQGISVKPIAVIPRVCYLC